MLSLSNGPNRVGVFHLFTWGRKRIQFPKRCVFRVAWAISQNPITLRVRRDNVCGFSAVRTEIMVFWPMMPCTMVDYHRLLPPYLGQKMRAAGFSAVVATTFSYETEQRPLPHACIITAPNSQSPFSCGNFSDLSAWQVNYSLLSRRAILPLVYTVWIWLREDFRPVTCLACVQKVRGSKSIREPLNRLPWIIFACLLQSYHANRLLEKVIFTLLIKS
jgi:hypothetical protein